MPHHTQFRILLSDQCIIIPREDLLGYNPHGPVFSTKSILPVIINHHPEKLAEYLSMKQSRIDQLAKLQFLISNHQHQIQCQ